MDRNKKAAMELITKPFIEGLLELNGVKMHPHDAEHFKVDGSVNDIRASTESLLMAAISLMGVAVELGKNTCHEDVHPEMIKVFVGTMIEGTMMIAKDNLPEGSTSFEVISNKDDAMKKLFELMERMSSDEEHHGTEH